MQESRQHSSQVPGDPIQNGSKQVQNKEFGCLCGKRYTKKSAVYTHIKNKHLQSEWRELRRKIIQPIKPIIQKRQLDYQIRITDIKVSRVECELLCLADMTLKLIFDSCEGNKDILIDVDQEISEDIDISDLLGQSRSEDERKFGGSVRQRVIDEKVKEIKRKFGVQVVDKYLGEVKEFQSFKIDKFRLTMVRELTKSFAVHHAALIQLSLNLIHVILNEKELSIRQNELFNKALISLWQKTPKVKEELAKYYKNWLIIEKKRHKPQQSQ